MKNGTATKLISAFSNYRKNVLEPDVQRFADQQHKVVPEMVDSQKQSQRDAARRLHSKDLFFNGLASHNFPRTRGGESEHMSNVSGFVPEFFYDLAPEVEHEAALRGCVDLVSLNVCQHCTHSLHSC